jgi:hypothetical protein
MSLTFLPETIEWLDHVELGEVEQAIATNKRGRVRFMATSWFARFNQPNGQIELLPGTTVRVIGRQGLTLLVTSLSNEDIQPQMLIDDLSKANQTRILWFARQISSVVADLFN